MCLCTCLLYILIVSCRINNSQARTKQYDDRLIQLKDYKIKILQQNVRFSEMDRKIENQNAEQDKRMAEHKTLIMEQNTLMANHKTLIMEQNTLIANHKTEQTTLIANQKTLIIEQNVELCQLKTQVEMLQTTQMEILRKLQINKLKQSEKNLTSTSSPIIPSSGSPVTQPPIEALTATVEPASNRTDTVQPAPKPTTTVQPVPEPTTTVQPVPEPTVFLKCDFSEDMCGWIQEKNDNFDWTRHRGHTRNGKAWKTGPDGDHTIGKFLNCDFRVGMCGWIQDKTDQFDWVRNSGPTSSSNTGPNGDHTTGNGYYVYIETSSRKPGDVARIISPHITVNTGQKSCFTFWYNMFGEDVNQLAVYKRKNGKNGNAIWRKTGTQGKSWKQAVIELDGSSTEFQIVLQATRGLSLYGDIAVDDFNIIKGSCSAFKWSINLYTDPLYAHKAVSDSIAVGDSMYVQVMTPAIAADLKMVLTDCYAKPTVNSDRSKWHTLIKNGCELDPSTHIIRYTNTETRFLFTAFAFSSGETVVDVHCDVRFCYNVKRGTSCRHGCNSSYGIIS